MNLGWEDKPRCPHCEHPLRPVVGSLADNAVDGKCANPLCKHHGHLFTFQTGYKFVGPKPLPPFCPNCLKEMGLFKTNEREHYKLWTCECYRVVET